MPTVKRIEAPQRQAVVVSSFGADARVVSTLGALTVTVDGNPQGTLSTEGLSIHGLQDGPHELTLGEGKDLRRMSFTTGRGPALDAALYSDRDVGSVLVIVGEDDVTVEVDGKDQRRKTAGGQVRVTNLKSGEHHFRVRKDGFAISEEQTVDVSKGQEAHATFKLVPIPRIAKIELQNAIPGTQVFVDDNATPIGTVGPTSVLVLEIVPGVHTLRFAMEGRVSKQWKHDFAAGETVSPPRSDLDLPLVAQPAEVPKPATPVSASSGMEHFENLNKWTKNGNWYVREGGDFALYGNPHPGRIGFSVKTRRRFLAIGSPRIRWVISFADTKNYVLLEMDSKFLYKSEFIDGRKSDVQKVPHKVSWAPEFIQLALEVTESRLIHRYWDGHSWTVFDDWNHESLHAQGATNPRNFADGKFGFYLPDTERIEVSNFTFYPSGTR